MKQGARRWVWLLLAVWIGGVGGELYARAVGSHFAQPEPLDGATWAIVSPGMSEDLMLPSLGRGTMVVDGALTISEHQAFTADRVSPAIDAPIGRVELTLAEDSDALMIQLNGGAGPGQDLRRVKLEVTPDAVSVASSKTASTALDQPREATILPDDGEWVLRSGRTRVRLGAVAEARVEFSARGGTARVESLRVLDTRGEPLAEQRFDRARVAPTVKQAGRWLGRLLAAGLWLVAVRGGRGPLLAAGALAWLPLQVAAIRADAWLALSEQLLLTRTPPWELAPIATAVAALPLAVWLVAHLPLAPGQAAEGTRPLSVPWAVTWLAALLAAAWRAGDPGLWAVLGIAWLALPLVLAVRARLRPATVWLADLPALVAVGVCGWAPGLGLALAWRLGWLLAAVGPLLKLAPRPAADHLFLLLLSLPIATEVALRGTYLDTGWRPEHTTLGLSTEGGALDLEATWQERCGGPEAPVVIFAGGSSTGGTLQFRDMPELYFPGRVHGRLCESEALAGGLHTVNYGRGAVDTHAIARHLAPVLGELTPRLVVMYVGVNDLQSRNQRMTRREREARQGAGLGLGARAAGHSRLLTGTGLWLRGPQAAITDPVQDVPLPDARLNHEAIAELTAAQGARLLLITEYIRREALAGPAAEDFPAYAAMQRDVAAGWDHVDYLDVWPMLRQESDDAILIDTNHLTRYGSNRLSDAPGRHAAGAGRPVTTEPPPAPTRLEGLLMRLGTIGELMLLLVRGGRWWMLPLVGVLAIVGLGLVGLQMLEYVAPFIYVVF